MIDVLVIGGIYREVLDGDTQPRHRYGGSGLTAAVAAARVGARVALASYVGHEDEATVRIELRLAGVDDQAVIVAHGASGTFVFPSFENSERPWPMYRPAESVPTHIPTNLPRASVVLAFGMPDFDAIAAGALNQMDRDATLIWDRQGWLSRARDATNVHVLPPERKLYLANAKEAMEDTQAQTLDAALAVQPPPGFAAAIVKCGVSGVIIVERVLEGNRRSSIPSFPVAATTTVGTGDVFAGAFAAQLAEGAPLTEAATWGCAAASLSLRWGTNLLGEGAAKAIRQLLREA